LGLIVDSDLSLAVREIYSEAGPAKRVVFVSGTFNIVHPGHLRLLRFASECGDYLVVGVLADVLSTSAQIKQNVRLEGVAAVSWVDHAFILSAPPENLISLLRPAVVVKGKEHERLYNPERAVLEQYGAKLLFSSGEANFSSVDLIRREFYDSSLRSLLLPEDYLTRHRIERGSLLNLIRGFQNIRICVIGDLIVDEYITCEPLGMSQEDPTIVVTPIDSTKFLGGAGIVAGHAAGLGASVTYISVCGDDEPREFASKALAAAGVNARMFEDTSRPTTLKQRYRSKGKSLLRVSRLHQEAISRELQDVVLREVDKIIENTDLLVFSDFNYGCLPQRLVESIISIARNRGVMLAADSQSSSQIGDISRFKGMDLITPTEREARISTRNQEDGLVVLAEQLRGQSMAKNLLLTLGEEGVLIHAANSANDFWLTDRISSLNQNPKDVAGAGDSLLIASVLALRAGGTIWESALLGCLAAAIQVGRVGNMPIQANELAKNLV
jgi:rfaE bifunctional protein kinase chain/domain